MLYREKVYYCRKVSLLLRKGLLTPKSIALLRKGLITPKSIPLLRKGLIMPNCIKLKVVIQLLGQDKNLLNQKIPNKNAVIKKRYFST